MFIFVWWCSIDWDNEKNNKINNLEKQDNEKTKKIENYEIKIQEIEDEKKKEIENLYWIVKLFKEWLVEIKTKFTEIIEQKNEEIKTLKIDKEKLQNIIDKQKNLETDETNNNEIKLPLNWLRRKSENPYPNNIICNLKLSAATEFDWNNLIWSINEESEPWNLTIIGLDTELPILIWNTWTKTILSKIDNWGAQIYLVEETGFWNINIFTLFREQNILLLSKQYNLFWIPFWLMMIGDCLPVTE